MPDELEIIPESGGNRPSPGSSHHNYTGSDDEVPIPKTVVEKVDPTSPSHGDIPGTAAHSVRKADAVPDVILQASKSEQILSDENEGGGVSPEIPIPKTVITKVDSDPGHGEVPGTDTFDLRRGDAKPDIVEKKGNVSGKWKDALLGAVQRANDLVRFTNICE